MDRTLLQVLQEKGKHVNAACGGGGTCKKCLVQIDGVLKLACQTIYTDDLNIELIAQDEGFAVLDLPPEISALRDGADYGLAVDIGTTTIAFALLDTGSAKLVFSHGIANSQRIYGADVISRIKAADEGNLKDLNRLVLEDIRKGISNICKESGVAASAIRTMLVAGNTTMLHILMGVSCRSLGQYPFLPEFISLQRQSFKDVFQTGTLDH